jgi:hypothetical protein
MRSIALITRLMTVLLPVAIVVLILLVNSPTSAQKPKAETRDTFVTEE